MKYQKEIETPLEKAKVVIKTMLTGEDADAIEAASQKHLKVRGVKVDQATKKVEVDVDSEHTDLGLVNAETKKATLVRSIVSLNGDATNCYDRLKKLPAVDYNFVHQAIVDEQKKMTSSTGAST